VPCVDCILGYPAPYGSGGRLVGPWKKDTVCDFGAGVGGGFGYGCDDECKLGAGSMGTGRGVGLGGALGRPLFCPLVLAAVVPSCPPGAEDPGDADEHV
jgi:hypothetical protein